MANYFEDNLLRTLGDGSQENRAFDNSLNLAIREMGISFGEQLSYHKIITGGNTEYRWTPDFIDRLLNYLSTDDERTLSKLDKKEIDALIAFEDGHTNSAEDDGIRIGCTVPIDGLSYVVNENGITGELCNDPLNDSENEALYKSLDKALMDIYNCVDKNTEIVLYEGLENVSPCE